MLDGIEKIKCDVQLGLMSYLKINLKLLRHLYFVNNLGVTDETKTSTKLWKLEPQLSSFMESFLKVSPEKF